MHTPYALYMRRSRDGSAQEIRQGAFVLDEPTPTATTTSADAAAPQHGRRRLLQQELQQGGGSPVAFSMLTQTKTHLASAPGLRAQGDVGAAGAARSSSGKESSAEPTSERVKVITRSNILVPTGEAMNKV